MINKKILCMAALLLLSNKVPAMDHVTQLNDETTELSPSATKYTKKSSEALIPNPQNSLGLCTNQALELKKQLEFYLEQAKTGVLTELDARIELAKTIRKARALIMPCLESNITELACCVQKEIPENSLLSESAANLLGYLNDGIISPFIYQYLSLKDLVNLRLTCKAFRSVWDYNRPLTFFIDNLKKISRIEGNKVPYKYLIEPDGKKCILTNPKEVDVCCFCEGKDNPEKMVQALTNLKNLKRLQLSSMHLKTQRSLAPLCQLTDLEELSILQNCIIKSLPDLTMLKNLKTLRLISGLEKLKSICALKNLEELELQLKIDQELPTEIAELKQLKRLTLRTYEFTAPILKAVCSLTKLEELHLLQEGITFFPGGLMSPIPAEIRTLNQLKLLHIENFQLTEDICKLKNLQELWISQNIFEQTSDKIGLTAQSFKVKILPLKH